MIYVGADLHQRFCYMTAVDTRGKVLSSQSVANQREPLRGYLQQFRGKIKVAVEACSFWPAFRDAVADLGEVHLVHPQRVKAIAAAKLKNDRIDSATLAHLLRCNLLPEAWMADEPTRELRQQVRLRATLVRQRTRLKNQVHAVLHQQGLHFGGSDLFGRAGRAWLNQVSLPASARTAVRSYLRLIDHYNRLLVPQDCAIKQQAHENPQALWLDSIPGVGEFSALLLLAEIGDIHRFQDKRSLISYAGLAPWVRESADKRRSGGITHQGSAWLRWIMVEAAHAALRKSPVIRAWFERLCRRKPKKVAYVALARKLLVAVWALLHDGVMFAEERFART